MKIYALPEGLEVPEPDYANETYDKWSQDERDHTERVRAWLKEQGYNGPNSGLIYRTGVADGTAEYMLVEGRGIRSYLLHLPYCDGYHDPNVQYIPKKELLRRMKGSARLFGSA